MLYPEGTANAGLNRWTSVKKAYNAGKLNDAKGQLVNLSAWVQEMAPKMSQPPNGETRSAAGARLMLYMSLYVYSGPSTPVPAFGGGTDNAFGLATPDAGVTVVTPSTDAGVGVPPGAVDEPTIIIITENTTPYPKNCSGPLTTRLCQYPRFYHFSQFPHEHLSVPAKFAVCHVNAGNVRAPLQDHEGFRLAHNKPANPADYTPGSTIVDDIEILPLITQTFSLCENVEYAVAPPTGLDRALALATSAIARFLTPKSAYAIDQGGGGESLEFSDFNDVDPNGVPDDSVFSVAPSVATNGDLSVSYVVRNVGTATSPAVTASLTIQSMDALVPPPPTPLTAVGVMSLVPGESVVMVTTVPLPLLRYGNYRVTVTLGSAPAFADSDMANNVASGVLTLVPPSTLQKGVKR